MFVDNGKIEEIRRTADIVDIISEYVCLVKTGNNYKGLCPFHNEKTPSFIVSSDKQIFHCFGCGAGGNVFTFLMKYENISFPDTMHQLAKKYGVFLKFSPDAQNDESLELLNRINDEAKEFFISVLFKKDGSEALAYLRDRDFDDELIKKYEIGFAPSGWESLSAFLKKKYTPEEVLKSGLVVKRNEGKGFYDRFRNRIIFPILDKNGRTAGFGGRALNEVEGAKYINSPETPIFKKSKILYGLSTAKESISRGKRVFVTEGYIDVIMAHKYGFQDVVAPLGTSLTDEHLKIIDICADNVIFVFDADNAGINAVIRSWEKVCATKLSSRVLQLPEGEDLDSTLRKKGKDFVEQLISEAVDTGEFVISKIVAEFNTNDSGEKKKALNKVFEMLSSIMDDFNFAVYSSFLADRLKVDENLIIDAYKNFKKPFRYGNKKTNNSGYEGLETNDRNSVLESHILMIALLSGEWAEKVFSKINPEKINDSILRKIAVKIRGSLEKINLEGLEILFQQENDSETLSFLSELRLKGEEIIDVEKSFNDCLEMFRRREIEKNLETNRIQIQKAVTTGNKTEIDSLLRENQKLQASVKGNLMTST